MKNKNINLKYNSHRVDSRGKNQANPRSYRKIYDIYLNPVKKAEKKYNIYSPYVNGNNYLYMKHKNRLVPNRKLSPIKKKIY